MSGECGFTGAHPAHRFAPNPAQVTVDAYRLAACRLFVGSTEHEIEIDVDAAVSQSVDGAFVAAWVWVSAGEVSATIS